MKKNAISKSLKKKLQKEMYNPDIQFPKFSLPISNVNRHYDK